MADVSAEALNVPDMSGQAPTSAVLEQLKRDVPQNRVTFGWLAEYLRVHSPEVPILVLAVLGTLPGISVLAGVLLAMLALAMITADRARALPTFIASHPLSSARIVQTIERTMPWFRWGERYIRPREAALLRVLRPFAGIAVFALSVTLLVPLPLSNVIPSLTIAFIAFACIESDGLLLCVSMATAVVSLAITIAAVWAMLGAAARMWG